MDKFKRVPERYSRLLWLLSSADTRSPAAIFDMRSVSAALLLLNAPSNGIVGTTKMAGRSKVQPTGGMNRKINFK